MHGVLVRARASLSPNRRWVNGAGSSCTPPRVRLQTLEGDAVAVAPECATAPVGARRRAPNSSVIRGDRPAAAAVAAVAVRGRRSIRPRAAVAALIRQSSNKRENA